MEEMHITINYIFIYYYMLNKAWKRSAYREDENIVNGSNEIRQFKQIVYKNKNKS